jgi:Co/Zn/Cd efflux system component
MSASCCDQIIDPHRGDETYRRVLWGNLAVLLAALGVFGTGTGWPDVMVAVIMASLALQGAWVVLQQSRDELRHSISPA